jgi:predicted nuclease with TOPRIM domain
MKSLATLESNVEVLLTKYRQLQQQLLDLQQENQRQREEMMRTHADYLQLKADYNHLETAYALLAEQTDGEQRDRVRQRLNNLIAQVDRALEALKQ